MEKKSKIIILIVIIIAVIVSGFVVPQEYSVNNPGPSGISTPPKGNQNSNDIIILLQKSMIHNDNFCYNFTVKQNITTISVEIWNNGTKTIDCYLTEPNGRSQGTSKTSPESYEIGTYFAEAIGQKYLAEGIWKVSLLSSSPISGGVIIYGTNK